MLGWGLASQAGEVLFETDCNDESLWELVDLRDGAQVLIEEDPTAPVGYGPETLRLSGDETLLFAKGVRISEGTILTLWKDEDPENRDCDGVIFFHADYPEDLAQAYNTKEHRPHYWIEQDYDVGFQIKRQDSKGQDYPIIEKAGVGKTSDDWNKSGWIWQKLNFQNGTVRAKYWSAVVPEPPEWQIEESGWEAREGRLGLRVWSGLASVAYFAVSTEDIPVKPPPLEMSATRSVWFTGQLPRVRLFLNLPSSDFASSLRLTTQADSETGLVKTIDTPFVSGHTQIDFEAGDPDPGFVFPDEDSPGGDYRLRAELLDASGRDVASASRTLEFRSPAHYTDRLARLRDTARDQLRTEADPESDRALEATCAVALLDLAEKVFQEGRIDAVDRTLEFAAEALDPSVTMNPITCDRIGISADSFVMGLGYTVEIDWRFQINVPSTDRTARLEITDDLGIETPLTAESPVPSADWKDGKTRTRFDFKIPEEFPSDSIAPIERPAVREGWHKLWLSLWSDGTGEHEWLDLPGPDHGGDFSRRYEIGRVYITQNPIQIEDLTATDRRTLRLQMGLLNRGRDPLKVQVACRLLTESKTEVDRGVVSVEIPHGGTGGDRVSIDFPEFGWWGPLEAVVEVIEEGRLLTSAVTNFEMPGPEGWNFDVSRGNEVWNREGRFYTPLIVRATGPIRTEIAIKVGREGQDWGEGRLSVSPNEGGKLELGVQPALGTYQVTVEVPSPEGGHIKREYRIQAPVFENKNGVLLLNGEPFIVKGVNVHGLIGNSPHRARLMMRILKEIGFNMLRGDYPPPWEVDMAEEENLGWLVLAPFSVTNTDALKMRHDPHPFARMREISRRFIRVYRDKSPTWFWNSLNEVTGETDDLLTCLYPLYKAMDPYNRPVVYANLTGQDRTLGQDLMGINYYYNYENTVETRQPLVLDSLRKAKAAGIPCIFNEFNCWFGPVYSEGARSVRGFYEYGIEHGMAGGFLYQLREDRDRHPGVVVDDYTLWTNPTFEAALRKAFADLRIEAGDRTDRGFTLRLKNLRPFTLRGIDYKVEEARKLIADGRIDDMTPHGEGRIETGVLDGKGSHILEAEISFTTHFGLESRIRETVYLEGRD
jgi:hypothetical protein